MFAILAQVKKKQTIVHNEIASFIFFIFVHNGKISFYLF